MGSCVYTRILSCYRLKMVRIDLFWCWEDAHKVLGHYLNCKWRYENVHNFRDLRVSENCGQNVSRCVKMRTWICYWFSAPNGPRMCQLGRTRSQLATTDLVRCGQRPLMTSQRCDDVTMEIFKIVLIWSESIRNAYNWSFKSPWGVSDR